MNEKDAIKEAKDQLAAGNVLLFPSDTIWGLSADATNPEAVEKVIDLKGRSEDKSFIVLIHSDRLLYQCIKEIPEVVWELFDLASSPLTIVLNTGQFVAPNVINKDGSLGIRMVKSGSSFELLKAYNKPIISTSPNFSGEPTPRSFEEIDPKLKEQVDYIYPQQLAKGLRTQPSKIIAVGTDGEVKILRK